LDLRKEMQPFKSNIGFWLPKKRAADYLSNGKSFLGKERLHSKVGFWFLKRRAADYLYDERSSLEIVG